MIGQFVKLFILFFVIFDPFVGLGVFTASTKGMKEKERNHIALLSVLVAGAISGVFLVFGFSVLSVLNTTLEDFRIAGGIVLFVLGLEMVLGLTGRRMKELKRDSGAAIAAIIATPLLTGPAAITAIILSVTEYGMLLTGSAVATVLLIAYVLFLYSHVIYRTSGPITLQVLSTLLGLVTLSWGIRFIRLGFGI